jgi:CRISPR/Cas system-associated endoribonuclease Cas2
MGRISMFCGVENYVLRYKSVYYKVITDYVERIQYSVFFAVVATLCIDSILYI